MKPVGKPDAGNRHVRFDERGWETGRRSASVLAPNLDSTQPGVEMSLDAARTSVPIAFGTTMVMKIKDLPSAASCTFGGAYATRLLTGGNLLCRHLAREVALPKSVWPATWRTHSCVPVETDLEAWLMRNPG